MKTKHYIDALRTNDFVLFQFVRYGAIGLLSVICFLIASNLTFLVSKQPYLSSGMGWLASFFASFMGHTKISFRIQYCNHKLLKFFLLAFVNLLIVQIITHYGQAYYGDRYWITSILVVCVIPLYSFVVSKLLIFTSEKV